MEHWLNEIPQLSMPSIEYSLNTMPPFRLVQLFSSGHYKWLVWTKSKGNAMLAFFSFEHCNGKIGGVNRINDQASRYGWLVSGRYLPRWLVGMKVKWQVMSKRYFVTKKGGPTNPLDMTDDPTCLNSNERFLTLKPAHFSDRLLQGLSLQTLITDGRGLHAHQFHTKICRSRSS
jgi:hypothetical protein